MKKSFVIYLFLLTIFSVNLKPFDFRNILTSKFEEGSDEKDIYKYVIICQTILTYNFKPLLDVIIEKSSKRRFVFQSLETIKYYFLDQESKTSELLFIIRKFPNLDGCVIKKKYVQTSFFILFMKFIFYLEENVSFLEQNAHLKYPILKETGYKQYITIILECIKQRIKLFLDLSKTMLKKEDGSYWGEEVFKTFIYKPLNAKNISQPQIILEDDFNLDFIKNEILNEGFIETKSKIKTSQDTREGDMHHEENYNGISFISTSSFCKPAIFDNETSSSEEIISNYQAIF